MPPRPPAPNTAAPGRATTPTPTPRPAALTCCALGSGANCASGGCAASPAPTANADPTATTPTTSASYICQFNPENPRHAAAVPGHPRTVAARQDLLLATLRDGLAAYALAPGRAARLAELLPAGAADAQARHDAQANALRLRLKQADAAEHNLITELNNAAGMPPKAADAYRARIRQQFVTLCGNREALTAQLYALDKDAGRHGTDPALLDELPELAGAGRAARTAPG